MAALQCMIKDFLRDGVIVECDREGNDYVSTVFLRSKRDIGDGVKQYRMILNVKDSIIMFNIFILKWTPLNPVLL